MTLKRGDHVCVIYSTTTELAQTVASFLAEGLRANERAWYVASADESSLIRTALQDRNINVNGETARGSLQLLSADDAYVVHGGFDPEATLRIFNDAIEAAYTDGFTGFRAAAEMSWALDREDGTHQLIVYEALLRPLFANCRAIGLCLYDRARMPLAVINGALATHPVVGASGHYGENPFYDSKTDRMPTVDNAQVLTKLERLRR
jgi:hypothetical protein